MPSARSKLGTGAEELGVLYLQRHGYIIVGRNFRTRFGEVDIIAEHEGALVFVEVRAKRSTQYGTAAESITPRKKRHLALAAQQYLQEHGKEQSMWRIDLLAVSLLGQTPRIEHIRDIVSEEEIAF